MAHVPTMPPLRATSYRKWLRLLLTLLLVAAATSLLTCPSCFANPVDMLVNYLFNFAFTAGLWLTNGYAVDFLDRYVNWKKEPVRRLILTLLTSLGGSLLVIFGVNVVYVVLFRGRPIAELLTAGAVGRFVMPLVFTTIISLVLHSRSFLLGWREAAIRAERMEKESAVARLDSLRRQVDPHFLFNSLNALTSLVEEDPSRAVRFIRQLSQVYRYVLDSQEQEVVPLAEEMRFVEAYLFLQRTRLGEGLSVETKLPSATDLETLLVPPLAVQLLLENALKHNATSQRDPLRISIELDASARQLSVRNVLRHRRVPEGESTGLGLQNLAARYAFLTPQPVLVEKTENEFVVRLPLLEVL